MPRRSRRDAQPAQRRRGQGPAPPADLADIAARVVGPGWASADGYEVRPTVGTKRYRCPYCQGWVEAGTGHIVAFPAGLPEERRHYHSPCWSRHAAGKR